MRKRPFNPLQDILQRRKQRQGWLWVVSGHGVKGPGTYDPGASGGDMHEAEMVRLLADALQDAAKAAGLAFGRGDSGYYSSRNQAATAAAGMHPERRMAVLHLHLNAGPSSARYALAMFDKRSTGGKTLSVKLRAAMAGIEGAPWAGDVRQVAVYDDRPSAASPWLHRAFGCIQHVWHGPDNVSATLLEVGFITDPHARAWLAEESNRRHFAEAVVQAVSEWTGHRRPIGRGEA